MHKDKTYVLPVTSKWLKRSQRRGAMAYQDGEELWLPGTVARLKFEDNQEAAELD